MAQTSPNLKEEIWEQSKEWLNAIGEVVNEMASKLGVASEHVYKVYTKQMFYEGLTEVISSILFIIFWFVMTYVAFVKFKKYMIFLKKEEVAITKDNSETIFAFTVINIVIWVIFMAVFGVQLDDIKDGAMMMFNPEYYTMKDLVDTVKELISESQPTE